VERADDAVVGGQPGARDAFGDHAGVAEDRRAGLQRAPGFGGERRREKNVWGKADEPGCVDHANGNGFFVGREPGEVGFGADRREGLAVDRRAVGFIGVRHSGGSEMGEDLRGVEAGAGG
jgi:hypothetical protein